MTIKDRPVRVLQVIDTFSMGGAETWLIEALRLWARDKSVQADFLLTSGNRGIFDDEAQALGARMHYLAYNRRALPTFICGFRRLLREGQYDAIHDHQDYAAGWHMLMAGGWRPPLRIVHVHNPSFGIRLYYGVTRSRRAVAAIGKRLVGAYATHITGTSRQILTEYGFDAPEFSKIPKSALHCGFFPERFSGNPVAAAAALRQEFGWPADARVILMAGRMDESPEFGHPRNHKNTSFGVDVVLAAMRSDSKIYAIFAGKPSKALPVLQARVAEAKMAARVSFCGVRTDIGAIMLGSDLLLFPSRGEGLGMVAVEAQACGLPVLASTAVPRECTVVPELVAFKSVDEASEAWAAQALEMMAMPRDLAAARRRVASSPFSIENSAQALVGLYTSGTLPGNCNVLHR